MKRITKALFVLLIVCSDSSADPVKLTFSGNAPVMFYEHSTQTYSVLPPFEAEVWFDDTVTDMEHRSLTFGSWAAFNSPFTAELLALNPFFPSQQYESASATKIDDYAFRLNQAGAWSKDGTVRYYYSFHFVVFTDGPFTELPTGAALADWLLGRPAFLTEQGRVWDHNAAVVREGKYIGPASGYISSVAEPTPVLFFGFGGALLFFLKRSGTTGRQGAIQLGAEDRDELICTRQVRDSFRKLG
ncbi:MAG: hypothetical protein AB1898_09235 [Acidobacteriota bacterium]